MQRRTALTLLTAGIVGPAVVPSAKRAASPAATPPPERLLFFSDSEDALLDRLSEMIIPADERSGGAHDAQVSRYVDREVAYSPAAVQEQWRACLKLVDEQAAARFGKPFLACDAASQDALMSEWARNEMEPQTELERFFVRLKRATAFAYYSSEVGLLKELGYTGNDVLDSFPGCTDPACKYCNA